MSIKNPSSSCIALSLYQKKKGLKASKRRQTAKTGSSDGFAYWIAFNPRQIFKRTVVMR